MKVSDLIKYIMKIIKWRDFKEIRSSRFRDLLKSTKVQILNENTVIQVVRKQVSFQDRKNENTPKFPGIEI